MSFEKSANHVRRAVKSGYINRHFVSIRRFAQCSVRESILSEMLEEDDLELMEEEELKKYAKGLVAKEKPREALQVMQIIAKKFPNAKNQKRLANLREEIENKSAEDEEELTDKDEEELTDKDELKLKPKIASKLYPYQIDGVNWLYGLFLKKKGCILGDDMGMGKTVQITVFISALLYAEKIKCVMIIMPVSLISTWEKEFKKWAPDVELFIYHETSKNERERMLAKVQKKGGVLLTTYGLVVSSSELFGLTPYGQRFTWDYVILDEGHKIKNTTKTNKGAHAIPARIRIVLTGTPIQNNLKELWALFDFTHHSSLLGTMKTFQTEFEHPISRSREKCASAHERALGTKIAESLRQMIEPYFLRRTKSELKDMDQPGGGDKKMALPSLGEKTEFIVWTYLSDMQINLYRNFLTSDDVQEILHSKKSPLVQLTILKKICDHPRLIANYSSVVESCNLKSHDIADEIADITLSSLPVNTILEASGKMQFLIKLCENLRDEGHRCLIFSQSRKILDMIQKILGRQLFRMIRIDGTVLGSERESLVNKFQKDPSYHICLLTVQVGGVGLTLTAADRVIIYDPSWNPGTDAQAVDRVYRIGQKKPVVVYRLITCGTVEEKIYRRQIFKTSLTEQMVGKDLDPFRYFTGTQIRELFKFEDPYVSETQTQLQDIHGHIEASQQLQDHMEILKTLNIFGLSYHTLMFTEKSREPVDLNPAEQQLIAQRMEQATLRVNLEAQMHTQFKGLNGAEYASGSATGHDDFKKSKTSKHPPAKRNPFTLSRRPVMEIDDDSLDDQLPNIHSGANVKHEFISNGPATEAINGTEYASGSATGHPVMYIDDDSMDDHKPNTNSSGARVKHEVKENLEKRNADIFADVIACGPASEETLDLSWSKSEMEQTLNLKLEEQMNTQFKGLNGAEYASGSATGHDVKKSKTSKHLPSNNNSFTTARSHVMVIDDDSLDDLLPSIHSGANVMREVTENLEKRKSIADIFADDIEDGPATQEKMNMEMQSPDRTLPLRLASTPAHGLRAPIVDPMSPEIIDIEDTMNSLCMMDDVPTQLVKCNEDDGIVERVPESESDSAKSKNSKSINFSNPEPDVMETSASSIENPSKEDDFISFSAFD